MGKGTSECGRELTARSFPHVQIFNPNVSFALLLCGVITPVRFVLVCIAQFVGSIVARQAVSCIMAFELRARADVPVLDRYCISALILALTPGDLSVGVALGFGTSVTQVRACPIPSIHSACRNADLKPTGLFLDRACSWKCSSPPP